MWSFVACFICIMFSKFIPIVAWIIPSYCQIIFHCMEMPLFFIHASADGHLDYFHFLAIVNNSSMNSFCVNIHFIFISPGHIPRSRIAGSSVNSMYNILRTCQTTFQSGCTTFHSHQQGIKVLLSPYICQHLRFGFFIIASYWVLNAILL